MEDQYGRWRECRRHRRCTYESIVEERTFDHANCRYKVGELHAKAVGHQGPRRKTRDVNSLGIRPHTRLQRIDELSKEAYIIVEVVEKICPVRLPAIRLEQAVRIRNCKPSRLHDENVVLREQIDQVFMFEEITARQLACPVCALIRTWSLQPSRSCVSLFVGSENGSHGSAKVQEGKPGCNPRRFQDFLFNLGLRLRSHHADRLRADRDSR